MQELMREVEQQMKCQQGRWGARIGRPDEPRRGAEMESWLATCIILRTESEASLRHSVTWAATLGAEVAAVLLASSAEERVAHLVQVAAVAIQWAGVIHRRGEL